MELMYSAEKKSLKEHKFAFAFASLPDSDDLRVDGNETDGVLDGNTT